MTVAISLKLLQTTLCFAFLQNHIQSFYCVLIVMFCDLHHVFFSCSRVQLGVVEFPCKELGDLG